MINRERCRSTRTVTDNVGAVKVVTKYNLDVSPATIVIYRHGERVDAYYGRGRRWWCRGRRGGWFTFDAVGADLVYHKLVSAANGDREVASALMARIRVIDVTVGGL